MIISLSGKRALVTGGGTGLGQGIVKALASAGAEVAFTSRKQSSLSKTLKLLDEPKKHFPIKINVNKKNNIKKLHKILNKKFGKIDILINNVGHTFNITDPFTNINNWKKVMDLNCFTAIEMVNEFIKDMKKKNWGRIVNITSIAGMEISGPSTYNISKHALTAYTKSVGRQLAIEKRNIVMTAVAPGILMTQEGRWGTTYKRNSEHTKKYIKQRTALKRFGKMEEITGIITFLCSDKASFFHSTVIHADGGQSRNYQSNL